jgi:hypothetical protein
MHEARGGVSDTFENAYAAHPVHHSSFIDAYIDNYDLIIMRITGSRSPSEFTRKDRVAIRRFNRKAFREYRGAVRRWQIQFPIGSAECYARVE